jgi:1,4-alpha-glucan branching enzyme
MRLGLPQNGDVVVSHPTATIEHSICVVPRRPHMTCATHDQAVVSGRKLAETLHVDAWLTEDHCHFLLIASFRPARPS